LGFLQIEAYIRKAHKGVDVPFFPPSFLNLAQHGASFRLEALSELAPVKRSKMHFREAGGATRVGAWRISFTVLPGSRVGCRLQPKTALSTGKMKRAKSGQKYFCASEAVLARA